MVKTKCWPLSAMKDKWKLLFLKDYLIKTFLYLCPAAFCDIHRLQKPNSNSLFRALIQKGFTLSIWFGYYEWFLRALAYYGFSDKPKSDRKYLFELTDFTSGITRAFLLQSKSITFFQSKAKININHGVTFGNVLTSNMSPFFKFCR